MAHVQGIVPVSTLSSLKVRVKKEESMLPASFV